MSTKTLAAIADEIHTDLGKPDVNVEISIAKIQSVWNKALVEFNKLVGVWVTRSLPITASATVYNLESIFTPAQIIDVKKVCEPYTGATDLNNEIIENQNDILISSTNPNDAEAIMRALAEQTNFEYTYHRPNLIINPPNEATTIKIITQEPATLAVLTDEEELIITEYALNLCEKIVARARCRQATPMRNGDLTLGYGRKEENLFKDANELKAKFEADCKAIIITRLM